MILPSYPIDFQLLSLLSVNNRLSRIIASLVDFIRKSNAGPMSSDGHDALES